MTKRNDAFNANHKMHKVETLTLKDGSNPDADEAGGDIVSQIMAYENGEMDEEETINFFQRLIDTGIIFHLQGSYMRIATWLVSRGKCKFQKRGEMVNA